MYLYGAGGHAKVIIDVLDSENVKVLGLFEDMGTKTSYQGIPVHPGIQTKDQSFSLLDAPLIICIGDNTARAGLSILLDARFGIAIARSATVSASATIGEGTVILQGAIVQADSIIGRHVIVNTDASIDHENIIGDFVHISPKATLCGKVQVGEGTHIGAGAVVIPEIKIGKWCVIGAGAVVIRDIPDFTKAVGNPARFLPIKEEQADYYP